MTCGENTRSIVVVAKHRQLREQWQYPKIMLNFGNKNPDGRKGGAETSTNLDDRTCDIRKQQCVIEQTLRRRIVRVTSLLQQQFWRHGTGAAILQRGAVSISPSKSPSSAAFEAESERGTGGQLQRGFFLPSDISPHAARRGCFSYIFRAGLPALSVLSLRRETPGVNCTASFHRISPKRYPPSISPPKNST
jgi:hypothetical protein